jgi:tRNA 2-thiouridine synthesizing protein A
VTTPPHDAEVTVDARGTLCPQPVIDLATTFSAHDAKAERDALVVVLLADDPAAVHDVPAWCRMRGCTSTVTAQDDGSYRFVVRRITST